MLAPGAEPRWAADAVHDSDVVVLAIPIHKFATFEFESVAGKFVVDPMNYWPPVDGVQELFEGEGCGSSEIAVSANKCLSYRTYRNSSLLTT